MMLKMSFFNECLASLTLQESNAIYAYTRCLEYYSRVQDYCLSLFTKVIEGLMRNNEKIPNRNSEEVCQILSIINFKIIQYSVLIQNTKGFSQTFRKITGCIHAMSAILCDNNVAFETFSNIVLVVLLLEGVAVSVLDRRL